MASKIEGLLVADISDCVDIVNTRLSWLDAISDLLLSQAENETTQLENATLGNIGWLLGHLTTEMTEAMDLLTGFLPERGK